MTHPPSVDLPPLPEPWVPNDAEAIHAFVWPNVAAVRYKSPSDALRPPEYSDDDLYSMTAHDIASAILQAEVITLDAAEKHTRQSVDAALEAAARLCEGSEVLPLRGKSYLWRVEGSAPAHHGVHYAAAIRSMKTPT